MASLHVSDELMAKLTTLANTKNMSVNALIEELTEDNLEQTETFEHLQLAISAARVGVWTLDLRTNTLTWNDELLTMYGITREQFDKRLVDWENAVHPDDIDYANSRLGEAFTGKAVYDVLFRIIRPDGEIRHVSGAATPILDTDGNVIKVIGNNIDITPIKKAEYALMDQASILRHVTDAVITTDAEFNILTWNRRAEALYGFTATEVVGKSMSDIVKHEYNNISEEQAAHELMEAGHWQGEVIQYTKDDKPVYIMASVSMIRGENGNPRGYVAVNRDITANKETQRLRAEHDALQTQLDKEHELAEWRATMMSTIAHELRTPLSVVVSSADVLQRYGELLTSENLQLHVQKILFQSKQLDTMIEELHVLSQAERGYLEAQYEVTDLQPFCEDIIKVFEPLLSDNHEITLTIEESLNAVNMDAKLMKMAVSNLLSNAIKYSPQGGSITLQVTSSNNQVMFVVQDEGIGIPDGDKQTLLEPFQRANNVNHIRGSGLGLSIVREVVKQHQGEIGFESTVGKGTVFQLRIPRQRPAG